MAKPDPLARMSAAELHALRQRVDSAIAAAAQKKELRSEIEKLIIQAGHRVADILGLGTLKGKAPRSSLPIRYRNSNDRRQTWTGRGRRPLWLSDAMKKGRSLDSFRV